MKHHIRFLSLLSSAVGLLAGPAVALGQSNLSSSGNTTPGPSLHVPGEEMIEVGGHRFQILRSGHGSPTVILESGISQSLGFWRQFQPRLNEFASVVSYSRAGYGASDPATGPRTPIAIAEELHSLLDCAGIKPPYVLVGHSLGVLYARVFAIKYPSEIAGLVFVDGPYDRQLIDLKQLDPKSAALLGGPPPQEAPEAVKGEWMGFAPILATGELGIPGKLPDVPTVVLISLRPPAPNLPYVDELIRLKRQGEAALLDSSTYGMIIVTRKSGHNIPKDEPLLVTNAIRWVLDAANPEAPYLTSRCR